MRRCIVVMICTVALSNVPARAGWIQFENGNPNGLVAGPISGFALAVDFRLDSTTRITGLDFWSLDRIATEWDGTFNYFLMMDNNSKPELTPLLSGSGINIVRTPTGNVFGPPSDLKREFFWSVEFDKSITLQADQTFWLGISVGEESPTGSGPQGIFWEATDTGYNEPVQRGTFQTPESFLLWTELTHSRDAAFRLNGYIVPEPPTLASIGVGILSLILYRCLRRRTA